MSDIRETYYEDLHGVQLQAELEKNRHSARVLLARMQEYINISSMLDVGCGLGTWLKIGQNFGFEIAGVEGPWCDPKRLEIDSGLVTITDLEKPIDLGRRFDLATCLEVGEHLSSAAAPHLVNSLVSHSDHVMFSAAVPFQGGHHHVNEQPLGYWIKLFGKHGYRPLDIFRAKYWMNDEILWWLRQNLVLFARDSVIEANEKLLAESKVERPIDIIHPYMLIERCNMLVRTIQELQSNS